MGSYKWGYKSPNIGYKHGYPTHNPTCEAHEPPSKRLAGSGSRASGLCGYIKSLPRHSASYFVLQAFLHAVSTCCLSVLAHALLAVLRTLAPPRICRCVVDVALLCRVYSCLGERYVCSDTLAIRGVFPSFSFQRPLDLDLGGSTHNSEAACMPETARLQMI